MTRKKKSKGTRKSHIINKRRKGILAKLIPWIKRFNIIIITLMFIAWIGAWIWFSNSISRMTHWFEQVAIAQSAQMGFTIQNLLIEGRTYSDRNQIRSLTNIKIGDPLFAFDTASAYKKILDMPWVKTANIERRLPDTIYVHVIEHRPIALYQKNGSIRIIIEDGTLITDNHLSAFIDLPVILGDDAPQAAPMLIELLDSTPDIKSLVKSATRIGSRRWDLTLENGITVRLPEDDTGHALKRLSDLHSQDNIINDMIESIDLRDPNRMAIRPKPGMADQLNEAKNKDSPAI